MLKKMRKMKERILSLVLTFVMVVSLFAGSIPMEVSAAENVYLTENTSVTLKKTGECTYDVSGILEAYWVYVEVKDDETLARYKHDFKYLVTNPEAMPNFVIPDNLEKKGFSSLNMEVSRETKAVIFFRMYNDQLTDGKYMVSEMAWIDLPSEIGDSASSSLTAENVYLTENTSVTLTKTGECTYDVSGILEAFWVYVEVKDDENMARYKHDFKYLVENAEENPNFVIPDNLEKKEFSSLNMEVSRETKAVILFRMYNDQLTNEEYIVSEMAWIELPSEVGESASSSLTTEPEEPEDGIKIYETTNMKLYNPKYTYDADAGEFTIKLEAPEEGYKYSYLITTAAAHLASDETGVDDCNSDNRKDLRSESFAYATELTNNSFTVPKNKAVFLYYYPTGLTALDETTTKTLVFLARENGSVYGGEDRNGALFSLNVDKAKLSEIYDENGLVVKPTGYYECQDLINTLKDAINFPADAPYHVSSEGIYTYAEDYREGINPDNISASNLWQAESFYPGMHLFYGIKLAGPLGEKYSIEEQKDFYVKVVKSYNYNTGAYFYEYHLFYDLGIVAGDLYEVNNINVDFHWEELRTYNVGDTRFPIDPYIADVGGVGVSGVANFDAYVKADESFLIKKGETNTKYDNSIISGFSDAKIASANKIITECMEKYDGWLETDFLFDFLGYKVNAQDTYGAYTQIRTEANNSIGYWYAECGEDREYVGTIDCEGIPYITYMVYKNRVDVVFELGTIGEIAQKKNPQVGPVITITEQPKDYQEFGKGYVDGELSVTATSDEGIELNYQWYVYTDSKPGTPIEGATSATFSIPTDLEKGIYYYYCVISGEGVDSVESNNAWVAVSEPVETLESWLTIDRKTGSYTITPAEGVTEYYVSTVANPTTMNEKIGTIVTSDNYVVLDDYTAYTAETTGVLAEGETLVICTVDKNKSYDYEPNAYAITGVYGYTYTKPVVVAPVITGQPQNASVKVGETATFSVTATGTPEPTYQWYIDKNTGNFEILDGATNATYTTSAVDMSCNGFKYKCIVTNDGDSVESEVVVLTVTEPPHTHTLIEVPAKAATCTEAGNNKYYKCDCGIFFKADETTETTVAAETIPASHSWVTDTWEKDATNHWHKCSKCTEVKDKAAHVDANTDNKCDTCGYEKEVVVTAPVITGQPQNASVKVGEKATFSVTATGDNMKYQWQIDRNDGKGFVNLSDATSASYVTSAVDMSCNGFKYQCIVSNEGGSVTSNTATLTVTEKEAVHTHSLTKVPEKAATCTEAGNKAYYTCSGCDSLYADEKATTVTTLEAVAVKALGHDMTDATCTEGATCKRTGCNHTEEALGHDWSGEWTIIKEATKKEEGKKETLCVRGCGQKKVVIIPKTNEVDKTENLEKDAEVAPDAPIDEVTLDNTKEEVLDSDIFTDEEKQSIEDGVDARVWLEVSAIDESTIKPADKAKVEKEAKKIAGENAEITYFDASLFKKIGNGKKTGIEKPGMDMKITIVIPKELLNDDDTMEREYKIIRLHKGVVDIIIGTYNDETGEYSFETDRFSTYAITYGDTPVDEEDDEELEEDDELEDDEESEDDTKPEEDTKPENDKKDEVPATGEKNFSLYAMVLMLVSGLGICFSRKKRNNG